LHPRRRFTTKITRAEASSAWRQGKERTSLEATSGMKCKQWDDSRNMASYRIDEDAPHNGRCTVVDATCSGLGVVQIH
jgi:hypothetical protein